MCLEYREEVSGDRVIECGDVNDFDTDTSNNGGNNSIDIDELEQYELLVINVNAEKLGLSTDDLIRYEVFLQFLED